MGDTGILGADGLVRSLTESFSAPVLFGYVRWILNEAEKRGMRRIYFLARDGYLLREMAERMCSSFGLDIECRYLYCSRASLRMPSYGIIGEEAMDLLLLGGYRVSACSVLQRAGLDEKQRSEVYDSCGLSDIDEDAVMSRNEFEQLSEKLRRCEIFRSYVSENSSRAYSDTIGYLRGEGLLDGGDIAIADSGWTGSMQRSLRQLLKAEGFSGSITGFYFGMYAHPKSPEDGEYLTWYFDADGRTSDKIPFCNNLFECILSAPHGMTVGYSEADGRYAPVLLKPPSEKLIARIEQCAQAVLRYTDERLKKEQRDSFDERSLRKETRRLIKRYMKRPTREEAEFFGGYLFCDDVTEAYHMKLADPSQVPQLKGYSIPARVLRRFSKRRGTVKAPELLWPFGTIAFVPAAKRWWYRLNITVWEWLRYSLKK